MAVYDDDIIPPVMPPIETDPYDPFVNGDAVRVRCPGTNLRTLFTLRPATFRCAPPINSTRSVIQIRAHSCSKKFSAWEVPEHYLDMYQTCTSNPQLVNVTKVQTGYTKNANLNCKKPEIFVQIFTGQRKCGNILLRSSAIKGVFAAVCILSNKRMLQDLTMRRFCNTPKLFVNDRITRIRHQCNYQAPVNYKTFKLCHNYAKTVETYKAVYKGNLGRCRGQTEIVDYDMFTFARICGSHILEASNVPNYFGIIAPRQNAFNCRTYEIFEQTFLMNRGRCDIESNIDPATRKHSIHTCRYESKFAPQGFLMHRGRCGVIVRAYAPDLTFGRIWGGRDPFVVQARLSGRLMGKIRDQ